MSKQAEVEYFSKLPEVGQIHARRKPFSDINAGDMLTQIGQIIRLLPGPSARVLDLGCGTGWTSRFLAQAGYRVVGRDIAPDMIEVARAVAATTEGIKELTFEVGDFEHDFGAGDFDVVLFFDSLHHADDERAALTAAYRALAKGGICVVSEPGKHHHELSSTAIEQFGVNEKDMPPSYVRRMAYDIGFSSVKIYPRPDQHARGVFTSRLPDSMFNAELLGRLIAVALRSMWIKRTIGLAILKK